MWSSIVRIQLYSRVRLILITEANTMNPDQTVPMGAVWPRGYKTLVQSQTQNKAQ